MRGTIAAVALVASFAAAGGARAEKPTVAAATVETTETAEIVRLVVAPSLGAAEPDVVCGDDSIRVRMDGVSARSSGLEELEVPAGGPMRRVRMAPRLGGGMVVQIHTASRPLAACSRTTAMRLGSEIVVSMALTKSERERLAARRAAEAAALAPPAKADESDSKNPEGETAGSPPEPAAMASAENGETAAAPSGAPARGASKNAAATASAAVGFGIKEPAGAAPIARGDGGPSAVRYALGFVFALAIAGAAFWTKRRKKGRSDELSDDIDIISTKRLSAHQQLIVAQVQGTKFLLAVSDKTVTNLGAVQSGRPSAAGAVYGATAGEFAEPVLTPPRGSLEVAREDPRAVPRNFDREMETALDRAADTAYAAAVQAYGRGVEPRAAVRAEEPQSNVAGLISMARMRATQRDARRGPVAEA